MYLAFSHREHQLTPRIAWKAVDWAKDGLNLISRMSASVFVGEELSRDETWQQVSTNYGMTVFLAARALRQWPRWLRPLVQWFLPACKSCRAEVKRAREVLEKTLAKRAADGKEHDDSITWFSEIAAGKSYDPVAAQLGMSMAAVVTTSELLKQTVIEICSHDLIAPLREEIEAVVHEHGWSPAALTNMRLLDSIIKETQRMNSAVIGKLKGAIIQYYRATLTQYSQSRSSGPITHHPSQRPVPTQRHCSVHLHVASQKS